MRYRYHDNDKTFEPFDDVFARFFGFDRKKSADWEFHLVEPLKELNLAKSFVDAKKLIKAAERGSWPAVDRIMHSRSWPFEKFMDKYCDRLQKKQDLVEFDNIDSAIYGENPYKAADSARHTYYNGLCLEWSKDEGRKKIVDSLNKRLEEQFGSLS
jgi:hypothetical protein